MGWQIKDIPLFSLTDFEFWDSEITEGWRESPFLLRNYQKQQKTQDRSLIEEMEQEIGREGPQEERPV